MANSQNQVSGWKEILGKQHRTQLVLLCFGVWLHAADSLMVSTIMPDIITDIGGAQFIAWTFALYEIGSIIAGAGMALLSLRYGLRASIVGAALLYMSGCLISAIAPEMVMLLFGRILQGLGGGGLIALALIAATRLFSRALLPRAMASISFVWGVSAFSGPLVGGVFSELEFWRGAFFFFAVQAFVMAIGVFVVLRETPRERQRAPTGRLPIIRLSILSAGVVSIAAAGVNVSLIGSPLLILLGIGIVMVFLYLDGERNADRLLPRHAFHLGNGIGAALVMIFCFTVSTIAFSIYGPLLMVSIYGISALLAGVILALSSVGWTIAAIVCSGSPEKNDGSMIAVGMVILCISIVGLMVTVPHGPLALIAVFALLEGAGFGMAWTFILRRVTAIAPPDEKDRVASALPTVQRSGYAFGAAYIGIIANAVGLTDQVTLEMARNVGFWIFAMTLPVAAVGLYAASLFVRYPTISVAETV